MMYKESDMGIFLQESFNINDIFKKTKRKSLKEDYETDVNLPYDSSADYNVYVSLPEVLGWLSEHKTAYEDCKEYFGVDFDDPDFDELITVHDLEEWISEHELLWKDYIRYFNIPDPFLDESLKEDFWNPGKEFVDFTNMLNSEFDESGWNGWNQGERDNFAEQVARQYLTINPTPTPMFFQDLTDNNMHTYRRAFERLLSFNESLKEDFSDARPATTKIRNFIEMGADPTDILDELLRFLPDGALVDFADYYGENFLGVGDDWE